MPWLAPWFLRKEWRMYLTSDFYEIQTVIYLDSFTDFLCFIFDFLLVTSIQLTHAVSPFYLLLYCKQQTVRVTQPASHKSSTLVSKSHAFDPHTCLPSYFCYALHAVHSVWQPSRTKLSYQANNTGIVRKRWGNVTMLPRSESYCLAVQVLSPCRLQNAPASHSANLHFLQWFGVWI